MWIRIPILIAALTVAGFTSARAKIESSHDSTRGAERLRAERFDWGTEIPGPLCGVYAASTAAQLIGLKADPRDFLATRYVGTCGGSTPEEVEAAVKDAGANAVVLKHMSLLDIRVLDCPIIANVRTSPSSDRFNHWVVVVSGGLSGIKAYDGMREPFELPTAEFLAAWNGIGICVSKQGVNPLATIWFSRAPLLLGLGIACVSLLKLRKPIFRTDFRPVCKQTSVLCFITVVLCILGNLLFGDLNGFSRGLAVATDSSNSAAKYHTGNLQSAEAASIDNRCLLVDARLPEDYRLGSIPGAVNIPINASTWAITRYLGELDRSTPVVVFCQSAKCKFGSIIGNQFSSLGFSNVTVCDEGWSEFVNDHKK